MMVPNVETSRGSIAVVGLGCWYPGARGPREFWENVLARRRQFRRIPETRLPLSDYHDPDPAAPDKTYGRRAAVIDGFAFDWKTRRIPRQTFEGTDVVQWLALEVAEQALADAGYDRETAPRERTGVILGNTLTGEHTRATTMRLRWPFVRRALDAAARRKGLPDAARDALAVTMEHYFKSAFAPVTEDTLAGGLSNTIAGRVCNWFDFHGGGYTVDGACSSSLLAIANAADRLVSGDLDMAMAGGVDVSLDTFELIGFAKTGALTADDMRVYDRRANGFLPGEGCGFVVLKRLHDARADGNRVLAVLRGWGISSDGKGGMTAPSRDGQARALRRAYAMAGYDADSVDFIEGHGTGTKVGDRVEIEAIAQALGNGPARSCGLTSLKSILGHTKAAAGVGAFIKAVIAVNRRVVPPTAGCREPNETFDGPARRLYPIRIGHKHDDDRTVRAGVSAMGFGGINAHVTLESADPPSARLEPPIPERSLLVSAQESEIFPFASATVDALIETLESLATEAEGLSVAELTDLAAHLGVGVLARTDGDAGMVRASVVAGSPDELSTRLRELAAALRDRPLSPGATIDGPGGAWAAGMPVGPPRIGYLFPGQGSQKIGMVRSLVERHPWARAIAEADPDLWARIDRPTDRAADPNRIDDWQRDLSATEAAQPAVCLASTILDQYLNRLGLRPSVVGGHSLGELTALHAAGAFDSTTLRKIVGARGRSMAAAPERPGAMASLACGEPEAARLLDGSSGVVVIANVNGPSQTVVSGEESAVAAVIDRATARGIAARRLPVSNAFHSPLIADAAREFADHAPETIDRLNVPVISSVDGRPIAVGIDLRRHLGEQAAGRVEFVAMVQEMTQRSDLLVEVGPGNVLSGLVRSIVGPNGPRCLPMAPRPERFDQAIHQLLQAAHVRGANIDWSVSHEDRLIRPYLPTAERTFLDNPCERPFQEPPGEPSTLEPLESDSLESAIADATGAGPDRIRSYLDRRHGFLMDVIRADLRSIDGLAPEARAADPAPIAAARVADSPAPAEDVATILIGLAAEHTGFPEASIEPTARLLDDLNLDSIKAAELVGRTCRAAGVAGRIDPSGFANASIAEIAAAIRAAVDGGGSRAAAIDEPEPTPEVDGPSWVRCFAIEYVAAAA